jgi:rod shape-determining protein MreD
MSAETARTVAYPPRVILLCAVLVPLAFLVQTALLPAVGAAAAVPVVFGVVVLLGVVLGARTGALCGFFGGLLLDVTGAGTLGVAALVGCLAGAAAARIRVDRWWLSGVPAAAALTVSAAVVTQVTDALLAGLPLAPGGQVWWTILGGIACAVLLLPMRTWVRGAVR